MSTSPKHLHRQIAKDRNSNSEVEREDREPQMIEMESHPLVRTIISGATGILFGIALEKGRVFEPEVIRDQMLFKRLGMLKMFLSASAIGMVCFSFLSSMPQTMKRMNAALQTYPQGLSSKCIAGVALGGAILGTGMTVSGACPGTVLVQLGAQVPNAWYTVAGGLCGAMFYALTDSFWTKLCKNFAKPNYDFLDHYFGIPYASLAFPLSCTLAMVVFGAELYSPWYKEVSPSLVTSGIMKAGAWPPFVAGAIIGTLQIPIVLANQDTLGSASSYATAVSTVWPLGAGNEYLKKFRNGMNNWWQVIYVSGAILGGYLSATASGSMGVAKGLPWTQAFGGGFLLLYGSRLAGGCTSGHGLSGMGLMALYSFIAVPAMFGGGIATAFFMKYVLEVDM